MKNDIATHTCPEKQILRYRFQPICGPQLHTKKNPGSFVSDRGFDCLFGAGNGIRTRDFNLGKVALYH